MAGLLFRGVLARARREEGVTVNQLDLGLRLLAAPHVFKSDRGPGSVQGDRAAKALGVHLLAIDRNDQVIFLHSRDGGRTPGMNRRDQGPRLVIDVSHPEKRVGRLRLGLGFWRSRRLRGRGQLFLQPAKLLLQAGNSFVLFSEALLQGGRLLIHHLRDGFNELLVLLLDDLHDFPGGIFTQGSAGRRGRLLESVVVRQRDGRYHLRAKEHANTSRKKVLGPD